MPAPADCPSPSSRRSFLRQAAVGLAGLPLISPLAAGEQMPSKLPAKPARESLRPLNRFPRLQHEWLLDQMRHAEEAADAVRDQLRDRAGAEAYVAATRERIARSFGPLPIRTPLNARVVGTLSFPSHRVEKVIFESRPGFLVTGNLYVPRGLRAKAPAVLGLCGHWEDSKADADNHQSFALGLVLQGYVCFLIDPVGQGERRQYLDQNLKSVLRFGVPEHLQMGNQQVLVGESLASWFAWDAIRALDYLETRPEVDATRLGATGCSGGATQTAWICALDPRLTMAAPACFITTFRRNAENEVPVDPEQCPPRALALGLDHSEFLAAFAPRPVVILAQERDDIFDVRGTLIAFRRLKKLYTLLGAPENVELHIGPDHHGYSRSCREAMYRCFNRAAGLPAVASEPAFETVAPSDLQCAPRGQVADVQSRTVMSFTAEASRRMAAARLALRGAPLRQALRECLRLPAEDDSIPDYRILRSAGPRQYPSADYCTYAIATEPGIHVLLTRLYSERHNSRLAPEQSPAVLYVSHRSSDDELRQEELIRSLITDQPGASFYACDLRGIGDSQPDTCGVDQFLSPYGSHYFYAIHGQMLDRPLLGQRTFDLLRVIQLLSATGHAEIHLVGRGWGAIPSAFASLLSPAITRVTLKNSLRSFQEIAETASYQWPCALLLPGVLRSFDLPDCYAELASKRLALIEPWGATDGMN